MIQKLRVLPVTVAVMVILFGVKLNDVWEGGKDMLVSFEPSMAIAAEDVKTEKKKDEAVENEQTEAGDKPDEDAAQASDERAPSSISMVGTLDFTDSEIEVLEKLTARRASLDKRSGELDMRDNLLKVTEARIDEKIAQLKKIEATIEDLIVKHDTQEAEQLGSLVRIYEKMKPKQAARIFNGLSMDILLDVASRMKESKMAAVLASMSSAKANELTVELVTRRQLPGDKKNKS